MGTSISTTAPPGASTRRRCWTSSRPAPSLRVPVCALLASLGVTAYAAPTHWMTLALFAPSPCRCRSRLRPSRGSPKADWVGAARQRSCSRSSSRWSGPRLHLVRSPAWQDCATIRRVQFSRYRCVRKPAPGAAAAACLAWCTNQATPTAVNTAEWLCQAQVLCGGQVRLQDQRFELPTRVPPGARSPCFAGSAP